MTMSAAQRAELRDAVARSRMEALEQSRLRAQEAARPKRREAAAGAARPVEQLREQFPAAPPAYDPILELPEAQPVLARLFAAVGDGHAADFDAYDLVLRVAADCVRAKKQPRNTYAKASL